MTFKKFILKFKKQLDTSWCQHSLKWLEKLEEAIPKLKETKSNVTLAKFEVSDDPLVSKIADLFDIQVYPTVKLFVRGKEVVRNYKRTDDEPNDFIKRLVNFESYNISFDTSL